MSGKRSASEASVDEPDTKVAKVEAPDGTGAAGGEDANKAAENPAAGEEHEQQVEGEGADRMEGDDQGEGDDADAAVCSQTDTTTRRRVHPTPCELESPRPLRTDLRGKPDGFFLFFLASLRLLFLLFLEREWSVCVARVRVLNSDEDVPSFSDPRRIRTPREVMRRQRDAASAPVIPCARLGSRAPQTKASVRKKKKTSS